MRIRSVKGVNAPSRNARYSTRFQDSTGSQAEDSRRSEHLSGFQDNGVELGMVEGVRVALRLQADPGSNPVMSAQLAFRRGHEVARVDLQALTCGPDFHDATAGGI